MSADGAPGRRHPAVGVIGLGAMGRPIAGHIARAGFDLVVHARTSPPPPGRAIPGAQVAGSPAEVAGLADIVLLALPDGAAVTAVVVDGIVASGSLRPGTLIVDLSTIDPDAAVPIGRAVEAAGGRFLDAPMSGGEVGAVEGTLSLMVGGEAADLETGRAVLAAFATTIVHVGPTGSGQLAKAVNQLAVMGTLEVVAEALTVAAAAGIDPVKAREVMLGGLAASRILELAGRRMLEDDYTPGGRLGGHAKDIAVLRRLAREHGLALPAFDAAATAIEARISRGDGDRDHAAIVRHVRDSQAAPADAPTITFASAATDRLHRLPGRDWRLVLGPQNSPSRRMTLSIATFPPGSDPGQHVHPVEDEIVHVLSGSGRLKAERGGGPLAPGMAFHVPAGLGHGAVNDGLEPLVLLCAFSPPVTPGSYDPDPAP